MACSLHIPFQCSGGKPYLHVGNAVGPFRAAHRPVGTWTTSAAAQNGLRRCMPAPMNCRLERDKLPKKYHWSHGKCEVLDETWMYLDIANSVPIASTVNLTLPHTLFLWILQRFPVPLLPPHHAFKCFVSPIIGSCWVTKPVQTSHFRVPTNRRYQLETKNTSWPPCSPYSFEYLCCELMRHALGLPVLEREALG